MTWQTNLLRRNDHSTIGGIIGAVIMPAILWKRASIVNCRLQKQLSQFSYSFFQVILGGAGLGSGIGLLTHYSRSSLPTQAEAIVLPVSTS